MKEMKMWKPSIRKVRADNNYRAPMVPMKSVPKVISARDAIDAVTSAYANRGAGGLYNPMSGAGTLSDKGAFFTFLPFWLNDHNFIEKICNQSWMATRFIDMPVDDMFAKGRTFENSGAPKFKKEATRVGYDKALSNTMKLGRKHGTGISWFVTKEGSPELPLDPKRVRKGDLVNIITVDRGDISVLSSDSNPYSPNFNKPEIYQINVHGYGQVEVHASRIFRFDGIEAQSINGWRVYEKDWGVSVLGATLNEVFNDTAVVEAVTQLTQEASIPVHKVDGLSDILCRGALADEQSVDQMMDEVSKLKSIYRTLFLDSEDSFDRTSVNFSNIPELMEKFEERMAMASGISTTRFLGKSPDGMNATGESDQRNDAKTAKTRQDQMLRPAYERFDEIVARSAGTPVPKYKFPPLFEMSDKEESEMDLNRGRTAKLMVDNGSWSPLEGKQYVETGERPTGELSTDAERQSTMGATNDPEGDENREVQKEAGKVTINEKK